MSTEAAAAASASAEVSVDKKASASAELSVDKKASASAELSFDKQFTFKLESGVNLSCTSIPVYKAFEESLEKMPFQFQIIKVKGFVKWQVDGAAGPTHAQLTLRRLEKNQFGKNSRHPWKKPVHFPLATFPGDCPSSEIKTPIDVTADSSNPFWKAGNEGKCSFFRIAIQKILTGIYCSHLNILTANDVQEIPL